MLQQELMNTEIAPIPPPDERPIDINSLRLILQKDDNPSNPRREWDNLGIMWCEHRRYDLGDKDAYDTLRRWARDMVDQLPAAKRKKIDKISDEHGEWDYSDNKEALILVLELLGCEMQPLYLYDHSGITMSTGRFSCPWDSGQVGIYVMRPEDMLEWKTGGKKHEPGTLVDLRLISKKLRQKARESIDAQVEVYDQYLTGDVWGFRVVQLDLEKLAEDDVDPDKFDNDTGDSALMEYVLEEFDSCWGFYGDDPKENGIVEHLPDKWVAHLLKNTITIY